MKFTLKYLTAAVVAAGLSLPVVAAPPDHSNASDTAVNATANGRPGAGRGLIVPNRHVYYPGDTLQVRVVYPRSLTAIWSGDAESHIVIHIPGGVAITVPVFAESPDSVVSLVELTSLDTSVLTPGDYQLALVLTVPGGDPLNIDDWYQGFRGLLSIERVRFSEGDDPADADGDGEFDDDDDGDGFGENEPLGEAEEDEGEDDDGAGDDGASDDGAADDGTDDDGATDDGTGDDGATDDGTGDDGATDDGATDDGATDDGGTDDGATDDGATDDGATDDGTGDDAAASDDGDTV